MSISNPKVRTSDATAANAGVEASNFAVPAILPEPKVASTKDHKSNSISDRELSLVQACCDFVCACIALPLSLLLLTKVSSAPPNSIHLLAQNLSYDSLFPAAVVIALALGGMYRATHRRLQPSAFMEMRDLSFGTGAGCVLALAVGAILHVLTGMTEPNATQLVLAVVVTVAVISVGRIILRFSLHALTTTRVVVVGSGNLVDRIMMSVSLDSGMTLLGRVVNGEAYDNESGTIGRVRDLPQLCRQLDVHRVLVAFPNDVDDESLNIYRQLQDSVHIAMVPRFYELVSWRSRLTDLSGMPFLEIARPHLSVWDQFMKRAFDLFISSCVLLVTSPLLLVVAIGVKLSSPGPVFFHQVRLGRHQTPFTVTKFRSMTVGTEVEGHSKEGSEPEDSDRPLHEIRGKREEAERITRYGAFLRRTGIDEIPQFINVFKGDMSVVGPRPFIPAESRLDGWGSRRFDVRPGITGLWQVSGRNDLSRTDLVQLDYLYVASWSLWWDLKIMWETPKTMARGTGAY
jgi:exopolysaccharide biosynthesis polyprenyl glycosylphosphotransferase